MTLLIFYFLLPLVNTIALTVTSSSFKANEMIPRKYTCDGDNINPEINISGVPIEAKSLALIMDDPDAPKGTFVHWVMWNIPVNEQIREDHHPGMQGQNGKKERIYTGPCPPSGTHHYHFKVYALDTELDIPNESDKAALEKAMKGHIISQGELVGLYKR